MRKHWLIGGAAGLAMLAGFAFARAPAASSAADRSGAGDTVEISTASANPASYPSGQPIAFPHDLHAGTYHIPCRYCHFSAGRSMDAGIPPVSLCMGCHALINGTAHPEEIAKLREYWKQRKTIPWVRIYKISDDAHFPHMVHVHSGITCRQCHGQVQDTYVLNKPNPVWGGHDMGWCVSCHRKMGASTDCSRCHY